MSIFERYLEEQVFAKEYTGTDDDMPDKFNDWLDNLEIEDLIKYADQALKTYSIK